LPGAYAPQKAVCCWHCGTHNPLGALRCANLKRTSAR
jgi:hypothetical protein